MKKMIMDMVTVIQKEIMDMIMMTTVMDTNKLNKIKSLNIKIQQ